MRDSINAEPFETVLSGEPQGYGTIATIHMDPQPRTTPAADPLPQYPAFEILPAAFPTTYASSTGSHRASHVAAIAQVFAIPTAHPPPPYIRIQNDQPVHTNAHKRNSTNNTRESP